MPELLDKLNALRGTVPRHCPVIEAQRKLEAKTKLADYAVTNAEVRPIVRSGLNLAELKKLVTQHTRRKKRQAENSRRYRLRTKAKKIAKEVAAFLKKEHSATRVIIFGSLATGFYEKDSDIDIYFEGVPKLKILRAAGHCAEIFRNHNLDLFPDAFCRSELLAQIFEEGIPL